MEFTIVFFIFGVMFLVSATIFLVAGVKDSCDYCGYVIGSITALLFGIITICCAVDYHKQEVENKNTEEKYNTCVDAGYDVYMDGQEIDGSKIIFKADEYKVKFDDVNKEIILQEKQ